MLRASLTSITFFRFEIGMPRISPSDRELVHTGAALFCPCHLCLKTFVSASVRVSMPLSPRGIPNTGAKPLAIAIAVSIGSRVSSSLVRITSCRRDCQFPN
jgi:hypothetical protein